MAGTGQNYAKIISDYLKSDPAIDAAGEAISPSDPLYGVRVGPPGGNPDFRPFSGIARGGIWTHEPKQHDPRDTRGATPWAFDADPEATDAEDMGGTIRPVISVVEESQINHFQFERIKKAINVGIVVWYYAPAHNSGKIAMERMDERVTQLLDGYHFTNDRGFGADVRWDFHFGERDNHRQFPGSKVAYTRFYITTLRGQEV